jgi:hypothetical protein
MRISLSNLDMLKFPNMEFCSLTPHAWELLEYINITSAQLVLCLRKYNISCEARDCHYTGKTSRVP